MEDKRTEVLAYYFPQYHRDPRNDATHGEGWTEWELLRAARPRFPGHRQPVVPAWGEFDESDPQWAAREIQLAASHGLTGFIYDWYWYGGQPFLQGALERGFLHAPNRAQLKFALMWANHDWLQLFPNPAGQAPQLLMPGATDRASFDALVEYALAQYMCEPNYLTVDGCPYFSIYELGTFIAGVGGLDAARAALEHFRRRVKDVGFPDLHLNAVVWGAAVLPSEVRLENPADLVRQLGFSSTTSYTWIHHFPLHGEGPPTVPFSEVAEANYRVWDEYRQRFGVPYHPNVSVGWDATPRTQQDVAFRRADYPWTAVLEGGSPEAFGAALERAKQFLDGQEQRLLTINAWNEWTEGSYLLPDTERGTRHLEALRRVFAPLGAAADDESMCQKNAVLLTERTGTAPQESE